MLCPFCNTRIKSTVFASSEKYMAIYNTAPILPGHSLIIPRKHICSVMELNDSELSEMMIFTRNVTDLLLTAFNAEAFNWSIQEKEVAGQSVTHLHLHIVPRYPGDLPEPGDWYPKIKNNFKEVLDSANREKLSQNEIQQIINRLRQLAKEREMFNPD